MKNLVSSGNPGAWSFSNGVTSGDGTTSAVPVVWSENAVVSDGTSRFDYITGDDSTYERWALISLKGETAYSFRVDSTYGPVSVDIYAESAPAAVITTLNYYNDSNTFTPADSGNYLLRIYENYSYNASGTYLSCTPPPEVTTGETGWVADNSKLSLDGMAGFGRLNSQRTLSALGLANSDNTRNTMFYLDGRSQADTALGAPVPNGFTRSAVTFDSDNQLVFDDNGSGCLELPDFDTAMFGSGREWTMDCYIRLSANSATYNNLWGQTNNSFGDNYLDESIGLGIHDFKLRTYYAAARCGLPESRVLSDTLLKGQWYFVAVDKYERGGSWHLCYYLDGAVLYDCALTKELLPWISLKPCFFCSNDDSGRRFRGTVARPRISACALYRGQPFNVRREPR